MNSQQHLDRRSFLKTASAAAAATSAIGGLASSLHAESATTGTTAESLVGKLYTTLSDKQRNDICFDWNHQDPKRGLLRTFVANNWNITSHEIMDDFYSDDQRDLITQIFESIVHPDWHERYYQQLNDDAGGFGIEQSIAIFGKPGEGKFELVLTGRHMTLRCDGNSADHVAFGGPIFYGHAPTDNESANHTDNVFWHQAVAANGLYKMLDGKQRKEALLSRTPREQAVAFRGQQTIPGLPVTEMSSDQKEHLQKTLGLLVEMYRENDQQEAMQCLKTQGGLDACSLVFYQDSDIGNDGVWDNWRLEGPSFVWHYRGKPHVHVWVNVADDPNVKLNT
ncbi:DUF3500 domain-containing protein [Rhodopirellula sp. MGV]|uniref:DUF3500 domain-containing protein n=1 Tax=Rhodopirellula sp. MGV TaxID=2023130 RepID=UPI000B964AC9|nr:DUF3500 domain-containing protein [Rhodopirellula sp. MGV]OYP30994.1 hypothetical protein CGZ80_21685 [Rhodopirellula sp. MGV]PNY34660.1 DUF3500 domain-containing protein [Rhodopirellula baltica]